MNFLASHWVASLSALLGVGGLGALSFFFPVQAALVLKWLGSLPLWEIAIGVLVIALLVDHGALLISHRQANNWHNQFNAEHQGRLDDQKAFRKAQAYAAAKNALQLAQVKAQQEAINERNSQSYEADLSSLRALLGSLQQAKPAASSSPGNSSPPDLPNPAAGPDGSGTVCISTDAYVSAAKTELQLEHLEQWVNEQMKVDPNNPKE